MIIAIERPDAEDVRRLLAEHLREMREVSPPESVHALEIAQLKVPDVTFWSARDDRVNAHDGDDLDDPDGRRDQDRELLGVGALLQHNAALGEVKSMRTAAHVRARGVASAILRSIIDESRARGLRDLALETGAEDFFAPARRFSERHGFHRRGPFADYTDDPLSVYYQLSL